MTRVRVATTVMLFLACGQARGQEYQIQTLPPLPGYADSFACGINEAGVVVGVSRSGGTWRPTRWQNGAPSDLGVLAGLSAMICLDISNDGNTIVGEAWNGSVLVPIVWENGTFSQIAGPSNASSGCWAINDNGVIAGRGWITGGANIGCRWDRTPTGWVYTELTRLPGTLGAGAFGVNNAGAIAGFCATGSFSTAQATAWTGGTPGAFSGYVNGSTFTSINMSGLAVGDLEVTPGGAWHAARHDGTSPTDLGTLVYFSSYAHRVNATGTIIGQSYGGPDPAQFPRDDKLAIVWRANSMTAVNDLIPPGSGWDVKQLWDINDSGRIVGYGRLNGLWRACLLIPVCYANCDASTSIPALTANDFQCFLNRFAAADTYANCDGSTGTPALTANDFQCFLNKFAAGCP